MSFLQSRPIATFYECIIILKKRRSRGNRKKQKTDTIYESALCVFPGTGTGKGGSDVIAGEVGMARGKIYRYEIDPDRVAEALFAVYVMYIIKTNNRSDARQVREMLEQTVDVVLHGLVEK